MTAKSIVHCDTFTDGIVGPSMRQLGPVRDGGTIIYSTAPACWGPMITPQLSGDEATSSVMIEGAKVGDAVAVKIRSIKIAARATSSGTHQVVSGTYGFDPFVDRVCPKCGTQSPKATLTGIGLGEIKCVACGASVSPFRMVHGYTMVFDDRFLVGVTVGKDAAKQIAMNADAWSGIPPESKQFSALVSAKADLVGTVSRIRPFVGSLGTAPSIDMPDGYNSGDFGASLVGASHKYNLNPQQLEEARTDGHLDTDSVREGAILICPVKIDGGALYAGDMHAMQGDGEMAGHTTDVAGTLTVDVEVIKGLTLDGPLLLPNVDDLPILARPHTDEEAQAALELAARFHVELEKSGPIQVIGSGPNLNTATDNAVRRASRLLGMSADEIKNRATILGAIEIGRLPGLVTLTCLVPMKKLELLGIANLVRRQYGLHY